MSSLGTTARHRSIRTGGWSPSRSPSSTSPRWASCSPDHREVLSGGSGGAISSGDRYSTSMARPPDPYRTLELTRGATLDEVKASYCRLAKLYHPDSAGEKALPRFLAIQAAYESPHRRAAQASARDHVPTHAAPAARPRRPNEPGPERGRSSRTSSTGARSASGGSRSGAGTGRSTGSGSSARAGDPGRGTTGSSAGSAAGPRPRRDRRKPTSTSYDGADLEPFEPEWEGASWYGGSSGTYWQLNPKEFADPRKHGPEYQARGRREAARAASVAGPATTTGSAGTPGSGTTAGSGTPARRDQGRYDTAGPPRVPTLRRTTMGDASRSPTAALPRRMARPPRMPNPGWWSPSPPRHPPPDGRPQSESPQASISEAQTRPPSRPRPTVGREPGAIPGSAGLRLGCPHQPAASPDGPTGDMSPRPRRTIGSCRNVPNGPTSTTPAAPRAVPADRIMAGDGSRVTVAQVARRLGVSNQASSRCSGASRSTGHRPADGRELLLTQPGRTAADGIFRRHAPRMAFTGCRLGWPNPTRRPGPGGDQPPGRGAPRRDARPPRDLSARQSDRRRDGGPSPRRRAPVRGRSRPARHRLPHHRGGRGGRRTAVLPRGAGADAGGPRHDPRPIGVARLAHLDGPRGRGHPHLRPAALIRVLLRRRRPGAFHRVPSRDGATVG